MKKILALVLVLALVLCAAVGCAKQEETAAPVEQEEAAPEKEEAAPEQEEAPAEQEEAAPAEGDYDPKSVRIAVMTTLRGNATLQTVQMGFIEKAKEMGYDPEIITIDGSDMTQFFAAGEAAIADGVQGIVIMRDIVGLEFFKKCDAAGVPCIAVHFQVPEDSGANLFANISCLPQTYGKECADAMAAELKNRGITSGKIAITQGGFNTTENTAAESFKAQMANYPEYEVMEAVEEGFDSTNGMQRQAAIIQSTADLVGAFTTTGGGAVNWANAATVMGKGGGQICIIGMDYTEANLALVKSGEVFGLVAQPLVEESALGAEMLDAWFRNGEKPASYFNELPAPLITSENVGEYDAIVARVKEMFSEIQA